jgi:hypothetical protein
MPEIWKKLSFRLMLPPEKEIGFEKRTVGEILLGTRGPQNHFSSAAAKTAA